MASMKSSFGQRWSAARPTKTAAFWYCAASMVVTMIIGFTWGGWVTGGTAQKIADVTGQDAVAKRLAPTCVVQFNHDGKKNQTLNGLKETSTWEQIEYVKQQG